VAFNEQVLRPLLINNPNLLESPAFIKMLTASINTSRLLFLDSDGKQTLIGNWSEHEGNAVSNSYSCTPAVVSYTNNNYYAGKGSYSTPKRRQSWYEDNIWDSDYDSPGQRDLIEGWGECKKPVGFIEPKKEEEPKDAVKETAVTVVDTDAVEDDEVIDLMVQVGHVTKRADALVVDDLIMLDPEDLVNLCEDHPEEAGRLMNECLGLLFSAGCVVEPELSVLPSKGVA
jgi:hypothetical protein